MILFNKISTAIRAVVVMTVTALLFSCEQNEEFRLPVSPFLKVEAESLNFGEEGAQDYIFKVRCNETYELKVGKGLEKWCDITKDETGDLILNVHENTDKNVRRGEFYIHALSQADTVNVAQLGWGKAILLSKNTVTVEEAGAVFDIDITANVDYDFDYGSNDWVSSQGERMGTRAHEAATKTFRFKVDANSAAARTAEIKIKDTDEASDIVPVILTVTQKKLGDYKGDAPAAKDDIQLFASKAVGDGGNRPGREHDLIIDGETNTGLDGPDKGWLCDYTTSEGKKIPQYIEITFEEKVDIDYVVVHPSNKEFFKDVEISVRSSEGGDWTPVCNTLIPQVATATRVDFPNIQTDVKQIKFNLTSSDAGGVFKCNEIQFFKKNPENFDPYTLFEDKLCTVLKPGISQDDILSCENLFYKNLAWYIFNNKYNTEFRVATYKARSMPEEEREKFQYDAPKSMLDNPTGISVSKDENLVVMADLCGLKQITLRVVNLDKPGGDGFDQKHEYIIKDGLNNLQMKDKGLAYVMYNTANWETAPEIQLHFASGKVNGYYDSENPALADRYEELLSNAAFKYFDVLGKYSHLTFETIDYVNNAPDLKQLTADFDELCYSEMEFQGLVKYNRMPNNRFYFHVMYDNYMYSTSYRTAYVKSSVPGILNHEKFRADCWGQSHEVGHGLQMRRFKWHGMTEVSNNMHSLNNQTKMLQKQSSLQRVGRYTAAYNNIIVPKVPHCVPQSENSSNIPFEKLVPFWQLELYFGNVLGKSPCYNDTHDGFYPDLYEELRNNPMPQATEGQLQTEFVYSCCKVAGMNLTDFFTVWGLLTPCKETLGDYGEKTLEVKDANVKEVKERIDALNLPKMTLAIQYITDNNWELYKNPQSVMTGTTTCSENTIKLNGWKNVVAFEVVDKDGKLVHIVEGDAAEFTLSKNWQDGYSLQSVAADGTRTKVAL